MTDTPKYFSMSTFSVICPEKSPCSLLVSSMRSKLHASNLVARFDCHTDSDHPMLTVKGHTVEDHLIHFARHYGVLGVFGEDGMKAEHPFDTILAFAY